MDDLRDIMPPINEGERHVPVVLAVDISGSMEESGAIAELNQGLVEFGKALQEDSQAYGRAEVCIIAFNSNVETVVGFRPAEEYAAPTLSASGLTSMNSAILAALDALEQRKAEYKSSGISWYRPWLFLLTDGLPTDNEKRSEAVSRLQDYIRNKKVVYIPMGIGPGASITTLQEYYPPEAEKKSVLKAESSQFREAFVWLSASIGVVGRSDPQVAAEVQSAPLPASIAIGL